MADVVTSQTLVDTSGTKTVMKFTNMSDGSGETLVTKMDASALTFMTEDATKSIAKFGGQLIQRMVNQELSYCGQEVVLVRCEFNNRILFRNRLSRLLYCW